MRIAVIGAGIVGVTTAYELAADGHEPTVYERLSAVAGEASFANAGLLAPGCVAPPGAPGMAGRVLRQSFGPHRRLRFGGAELLTRLPWLWRWWRACGPRPYRDNRERLYRLARYSRERLHACAARHGLDYQRSAPVTVLLRGPRELVAAEATLRLLREWEVAHALVDAAHCRRIEPGLHPDTPLQGGIAQPDAEAGNCRLFAQQLKAEAEQLGARFCFATEVLDLDAPGARAGRSAVQLRARGVPGLAGSTPSPQERGFDAVVVCTGAAGNRLLRPLGLALPLLPVHGHSVTAPLRDAGEGRLAGPRGAVLDQRHGVTVSRLGQRLRVAGSAGFGRAAAAHDPGALAMLYRVLDDWFPGAARHAQAQAWMGARPMLPDGVPVIGAGARAGVWLNIGHGGSGWALACGSARLLADQIGGRAPELDAAAYAMR